MTTSRRAPLTVERIHQPDAARCIAAVKLLLSYRRPAPPSENEATPAGTGVAEEGP